MTPPLRLALALALALVAADARAAGKLNGFNVIVSPGHPFGSAQARASLGAAKRMGANAVAIVPFLWQSNPSSVDIVRGADMSDDELRAVLRDARALGLKTIVKRMSGWMARGPVPSIHAATGHGQNGLRATRVKSQISHALRPRKGRMSSASALSFCAQHRARSGTR